MGRADPRMKWPFVSRSYHDAALARLNQIHLEVCDTMAAERERDRVKYRAHVEGITKELAKVRRKLRQLKANG